MDIEAEIFKFVAEVDIIMVAHIMLKINQDGYKHYFGRDKIWVCRARNVGFLVMAFMLASAIWKNGSRESLLWLFYSASYSIYVNCVALHFRK